MLCKDPAHWEFEIFVSVVFDLFILGICWNFVKKHWKHHIDSDKLHGFDEKDEKK